MVLSRVFVSGVTAVATLISCSAALGSAVPPGKYVADAKGVDATVEVTSSGATTLRYALKTACGKTSGKIVAKERRGKIKGKRVSKAPDNAVRTTKAAFAAAGDGTRIAGKLADALRQPGKDCADKRRFAAELGETTATVGVADTGRYTGTNATGMPISFDVEYDPQGGLVVRNLAVEVRVDCWEDLDGDGVDDQIVAHLSGLSGTVDWDGEFEVFYLSEDGETEYDVSGALSSGTAELEVTIGGFFDLNGYPSATGPRYCDSWGDLYSAARAG